MIPAICWCPQSAGKDINSKENISWRKKAISTRRSGEKKRMRRNSIDRMTNGTKP